MELQGALVRRFTIPKPLLIPPALGANRCECAKFCSRVSSSGLHSPCSTLGRDRCNSTRVCGWFALRLSVALTMCMNFSLYTARLWRRKYGVHPNKPLFDFMTVTVNHQRRWYPKLVVRLSLSRCRRRLTTYNSAACNSSGDRCVVTCAHGLGSVA